MRKYKFEFPARTYRRVHVGNNRLVRRLRNVSIIIRIRDFACHISITTPDTHEFPEPSGYGASIGRLRVQIHHAHGK